MLASLFCVLGLAADTTAALSGRVTDTSGAPLAEVRVVVVELGRLATTGPEGRYAFGTLPAGTYSVSFSLVGFSPQVRRVRIGPAGAAVVDVTLRRSLVKLPPVQVSAGAVATSALTSPQPTSVVAGAELRTAQAPSVGATIEAMPGVRSWSTGVGIGKPVIRGLTSNRVLVVADGQRMEYQQWGDEHSPNVETVDAASIEVVRGPASVLYGSDALGGVVNIVSRPLPDAIGARPFARGRVTASYATNNRNPDGTVMVEGATAGFGWRASLTGRTSSDVRTPASVQFNSGNRAFNGNVGLGYRGDWGEATLTLVGRDERIEIHEDPAVNPMGTSYQRLRDERARVDVMLPVGGARLEAALGVERNRRSEYGSAADVEVTTGLLSRALTTDLRLHHAPLGPVAGIVGVSAIGVWFDGFGRSALVPDNRWRGIGAYAFEQVTVDRWDFSLGARIDYRTLDAEASAELGNPASARSWSAVTGNIGVLHRATEGLALVLNVGRGFRTPSGPELFANGVHQGVLAYEIGNPDLEVETSFNVDASVRVQTARVRAEASVFRNAIDNFIYLRPTGTRDGASQLPVYRFEQGDARLVGFEAAAAVRPWDPVEIQAGVDYVHGHNVTADLPLPWIPPLRVLAGARLEGDLSAVVRDAYVGVTGETNVRQTRLDPQDYAPPGYTVFNVEAGFALPRPKGALVDLALRNAFDARYTRFMNRYKTFALEQGRNFILRITAPF